MTSETKIDTKTTEATKPATSTTDNKAIFGPLGKYAVIAVIMVSIIVTTAIMLNKQLGNTNEQLAAIESEVAEMNATASTSSTTQSDAAITAEADISASEVTPVVTDETQEVAATSDATPATEVNGAEKSVAVKTTQTPVTEVVASQTANTEAPAHEAQHMTAQHQAIQTQASQSDSLRSDARQAQLAANSKARIEAFKLEQKQRMSEMFARIRMLEAQQLEHYKANQDKRVERLRSQIAQQQQVIEALILRNEESLKMRAASVQKHQTSREQVLNRI